MNTTTDFNKKSGISDMIALIIFAAYFYVDLFPIAEHYQNVVPQYYYINILNIGVGIYLLFIRKSLPAIHFKFIKPNAIFLVLFAFILISSVSSFVAINTMESIITLTRYTVFIVLVFNLYFLFVNKLHLFKYLCLITAVFLVYESFEGLRFVFANYRQSSILDIIMKSKINHGNKNVFSSTILLKIPFVIYGFLNTKGFKRIFYLFTLFMASWMLFTLSTRALIIGFFVMIALLLFSMYQFKWGKPLQMISILIAVGVAYCIAFVVIKNGIQTSTNLTERNADISLQDKSLQMRLNYWDAGLRSIVKKPILGCGVGNWKIESIPYEYEWQSHYSHALHMHNDFLEVAAESGIVAGILFILIFVLVLYFNIKNILKNQNTDKKQISIVLILVLVGYTFDSFFNFPLQMATVQLVFALLLMLTIVVCTNVTNDVDVKHNSTQVLLLGIFTVLSIATVYPNYLQNRFDINMKIVKTDKKDLAFKSDEVEKLLRDFPNLDALANPQACYKAMYYIEENNFDEALNQANIAIESNPNGILPYSVLNMMYFKQNKLDSVFKYTKLMHDMMPLSIKFYEPYVGFMSSKRDTMGISTAFKNLDHSKLKPDFFKATYNALIASGANKNASIKVIEEGIQLNPTDTILNDVLGQYKIEKGRIAEAAKSKVVVTKQLTQQQQFEQILNQNITYYNANKTDMAGAKNVGLCYFQLQNYSQAIVYMKKVVASKKFTNGEAEYVLAASYAKLNDKNNACQYAQDGLAKGLAICKNIIDLNCK